MYIIDSSLTVAEAKKVPLARALDSNTVAELKSVIDSFCLPVSKSGRKQQLIDNIIAYISANPMWIKDHLRFCELESLHAIAEEGYYECISMMAYLNRLIRYGLLYVLERPEEGADRIYMPAELKEILRPCFKREKDYDINESIALYQVCIGMANICGAVMYSEIIAYMQSLGHDIKWPHEISLLLEKYGYPEYTDVVRKPEGTMQVLYSPWLEFMDFPRATIEFGREIKFFPPEDVIKSANEIFLLPPSNPYDKRLDDFMKRTGKADDIQWVKMEAYNYHQEGGNGYLSIINDLQFSDHGQVQEFVRILTDYTNNVPMWEFRGWSSEEVFRGRISYDSEPVRGTVISNGDETYRRGIKVGRNDPCPCGSGKKYKKCCGKNG